jgi:maltooligosyltrehalose trehalohydrolase
MTHRRHEMPFGARVLESGRARFRLWAPSAQRVELYLGVGNNVECRAMTRATGGWFSLESRFAEPGYYRYRINGEQLVPDPASRFQPDDAHGPSQIIDPNSFDWEDREWRGRRWEEVVIYELHVGSFTEDGRFQGVKRRLDYLLDLGVTAIELMPIADFPGDRNWGYDGVLPFAPDSRYGTPDDLKDLVQAAHAKGLMIFLDVVYNHFGPDGNYLHAYAKDFFAKQHVTPWGEAINFDDKSSHTVRAFFIHNALYWLEEFHLDGLRLDAVDTIADDSDPGFLVELAQAVHRGPGKERYVHLVLENGDNAARYLERDSNGQPRLYTAQWNDDAHHVMHTLMTGEDSGYYVDYADKPLERLARALTEGFVYQGEPSIYWGHQRRGESSRHLPPTAFVNFLQNHDQVGNRAFGERINALSRPEALRAATAILLLSPMPPLLFMGQEWASGQPFLFFCDFESELAAKVKEGRLREFARFPEFKLRDCIPDPVAEQTIRSVRLDWERRHEPSHRDWLELHRKLLAVRGQAIVPHLRDLCCANAEHRIYPPSALAVGWRLNKGVRLSMVANLGDEVIQEIDQPEGDVLFQSKHIQPSELASGLLPPWSVAYFLER